MSGHVAGSDGDSGSPATPETQGLRMAPRAPYLTVDPGETTGWTLWSEDWEIVDGGQTPLWEFIDELRAGIVEGEGRFGGLALIVCEDWAIYPWEAQNLAWDKCRTARGIGAIELLCRYSTVELVLQPAKIKETAVAAGAEDLYVSPRHPNRHQNDAIQHGVYYRLKHGRAPS